MSDYDSSSNEEDGFANRRKGNKKDLLMYTGKDEDFLPWKERLEQNLKGNYPLLWFIAMGIIEPPAQGGADSTAEEGTRR